ncbi:neurocan core protein-like isoform X2 [Ruditapes philippinarum]|uniref:neurocan core protein-like isoform X2 n=1 Tax=Ruditapes philippinarum TaxID=129788 RepID=UPI00295B220D|nr:neurocan core protein-like isoform X2 [Ruditapes philippinarum]
MKFLLFILVIIGNLNVYLANNDNCGVNDLNALMVRLLQLRTEFNNFKIQHDEQIAVLKEEINNKSLEIKLINEENRKQETELEELRQDVNNKSLEIAAISKDIEMIKDIDDCSPNQCQNGATCVDGVTSYTCLCVAGYNGTLCEIDIDECTPDPCQNGATCTDGVDSYTCTCVNGYVGTYNCETENCPANWYLFQGSCYFRSTKALEWLKAEEDCIALGGHLVEITSEEENNFTKSILSGGSRFWIGLNDIKTEGDFVWVSSGNTASGVYTKWAPTEPNDTLGNEDCVELYSTGDWKDRDCSEAWHYICEKLPD